MKNLIENIKESEGFVGVVYKDTEGFDTIGYGTKLPLTKEESELLLESRLKAKIKELEQREPFINSLPLEIQEVIAEMCYQMGVSGVLGFKKMWAALKKRNYPLAAAEMLDSKWSKQTPNRAKRLSLVVGMVI